MVLLFRVHVTELMHPLEAALFKVFIRLWSLQIHVKEIFYLSASYFLFGVNFVPILKINMLSL